MKEVTPFRVVHPVQGEARKVEPKGNPIELTPIMAFNPFGFVEGIRNFGPVTVVEEQHASTNAEVVQVDEGDVGPKAATSSVTGSASDSGSDSELTQMLMHPSTPLPDPESHVSAAKESSLSSESPEMKNDGWPLPLALE